MEMQNKFEVLVRRRIPFLSSFLWWMIFIFAAVLFVLYLIMWPTKYLPREIGTLYFIRIVPDLFKIISFFAGVCFIIFTPIYYAARQYKPATLTYDSDSIAIKGKQIEITILQNQIAKIFFNDLHNLLRQPKNKIQIVIRQKNKKLISFLLKNYGEGEHLIETLGNLENTKFAFYDDNMVTNHEDE